MPSGKNSIPKMAVLCQHLEEAGFERVRTYIQSGNILLLSDLPKELLSQRIHDLIKERIGADLTALVFLPEELQAWVDSLPFADDLDPSRIFFTMTMECPTADRLQELSEKTWGEEAALHLTERCAYIYAPKTYKNTRLTFPIGGEKQSKVAAPYAEVKESFETLLVDELLSELYDTEKPFTQTGDAKQCAYCPFALSCGR